MTQHMSDGREDRVTPGADRIIALLGPTASGKSTVALELAGRVSGEIVSVDSMQVYRGMDIGTAKPSKAEQGRIPHHLIDVVDVAEAFDAATYGDMARRAISAIEARGKVPVLCGGTGLYYASVRHGLGAAPAASPVLREALEQEPLAVLLEELHDHDPASWMAIDRGNRRRVVRAVEVLRLTGRPLSEQRAPWPAAPESRAGAAKEKWTAFGLLREGVDLANRIDLRVEQMFQQGLVEETRELMRAGLERNRTAMQAIGYCQAVEHLRGSRALDETIALVKRKTRQLAKRQLTWFRKEPGLTWMTVTPEETPSAIAERIQQLLRNKGVL